MYMPFERYSLSEQVNRKEMMDGTTCGSSTMFKIVGLIPSTPFIFMTVVYLLKSVLNDLCFLYVSHDHNYGI